MATVTKAAQVRKPRTPRQPRPEARTSTFDVFRSQSVENVLAEYSVEPVVDPARAMSRVRPRQDQDKGVSTAQVRVIDTVNQERVQLLREVLESGGLVGAIVVNDMTDHDDVVNGNHRFLAHQAAGRVTIPCYVISVKPEMAQSIALRLQAVDETLPLSAEEKRWWVLNYASTGMPATDIVKQVGLTLGRVRSIISSGTFADKLVKIGVDPADKRIRPLVESAEKANALKDIQDHKVLKKAVEVAASVGMSKADIKNMVDEVIDLGDADAALVTIERIGADKAAIQATKAARAQEPPARAIRKAVGAITKFDADDLVRALDNDLQAQLVTDAERLITLFVAVLYRLGHTVRVDAKTGTATVK